MAIFIQKYFWELGPSENDHVYWHIEHGKTVILIRSTSCTNINTQRNYFIQYQRIVHKYQFLKVAKQRATASKPFLTQ